ncbi:ABC transporter ATP-binding protein [Candidatus Bipolaricaulota bacterium]|nr:ABC transporter ATP-binding protein [Candidatus Bipolaricaulota bacterium]
MEALRLESLSKSFGGVDVLTNVSLTVNEGERVVLIGPNGAGKTTTFNLINGQYSVTSGSIYLYGQDITKLPVHRRGQLGIARSFQITSVYANLTVLDNAILTAHGCRRSRFHMLRSVYGYKKEMAIAQEALESVGLWEARDELVANLAYGQQRRLEIALTLASQPRLLLLDEPSCGLTSGECSSMIDVINSLPQDITTIVVAHDMDLIFGVADRIIVLYYGTLLADGSPEEIQADPRVKEIYMGVEEGTRAES